MSLNKKKTVREIGRRTHMKNRDVQAVIETLIEVWTEELARSGRIEIEHFFVLTADPAGSRLRVKISNTLRRRIQLLSDVAVISID
jgi:nucleoid DNA-binding protein